MALAESIFAKLSDAAGATAALVGSGNACRVYPENAPEGAAVPYAICNEISANGRATHGETVGTTHRLYQFACFAITAASARAIRDAIISDLDNQELSNGDSPTLQDERSGFEGAVDLFRADADFLI